MLSSDSFSREATIPYKVQRIIGKYTPAIRARIMRFLEQRKGERGGAEMLKLEDVGWAVSCALDDLVRTKSGLPKPDPRMVSMSLAAFNAKDGCFAEDYVHDLKASLAGKTDHSEARRA
jgi:hypothetical protein